ncbi:MAG: RimK family alpha-L-glutamate ligase [Firmicutes bacterium]|jgi:ribosomal protein S6--L-glutamate ligase/gamma-F420-2:alpha-L-glutamate ligase|nr:RimK family alpha-L-glutamate ligase [Bacillota bacterium]
MDLVDYFVEEMSNRGVLLEKVSNLQIIGELNTDINRLIANLDLKKPDFAILWDKDVTLGRHLEKMGLRVFNSSRGIELCDNKGYTFEVLSEKGINIPRTIIAPLIYPRVKINDFQLYENIAIELGYPLVIKECYGSFGAQVYLIENFEQMKEKVISLGSIPYVFQEFISTSHGRDVRINVVGDLVVGSMYRESDGDFRANISAGGKGKSYIANQREEEIAIKAVKELGLDYAGVDILFGKGDQPVVCEVNSNPHFKSTLEYTGVDVGKAIVEYILKEVYL